MDHSTRLELAKSTLSLIGKYFNSSSEPEKELLDSEITEIFDTINYTGTWSDISDWIDNDLQDLPDWEN